MKKRILQRRAAGAFFVLAMLASVTLALTSPAIAQPTKAGDVQQPPKTPEHADVPMKPGSIPGCTLVRVIDPRTLAVQIDAGERQVRLLGIQAHDAEQVTAANGFLENTLKGETLTIVVPDGVGVDKDAKPLVFVRREPEGMDVGLELLRQGMAKLDPKFDELAKSLPAAQAERYRLLSAKAKDLKKGLWGMAAPHPAPSPPKQASADVKQGKAADSEMVYVTPTGKKYHRQGCKFLTKNAKPITLEEARKKYEPCNACTPSK